MGAAVSMGVSGCGLGLSGLEADGPIADAGARSDVGAAQEAGASNDARSTPVDSGGGVSHDAREDTTPVSCASSLPPDWSPALFEHARAGCPPSSTGTHDAVAGGVAGAGACTCSCAVGGPVTCETGMLQMASGNGPAACTGATTSVAVEGEFCAPLAHSIKLPAYVAVPTVPPTGACTASVAADPAQISKDTVRWCDVPGAGSAEGVCTGAPPTGFAACIVHAGSVACPSGSAFTARTVVSDDVILSCAACSTCELTGQCGAATVAFFTDGNCNNSIIAVNADGTCGPTGAGAATAGSVLYNASVVDAGGCIGGGTSASVTATGQTTTVCCR